MLRAALCVHAAWLCSGDWCQWSAYIAMISVTSTYISAAWVAYATFKCVHMHEEPYTGTMQRGELLLERC